MPEPSSPKPDIHAIRLAAATVSFKDKNLVFDCTIPQGASVAVTGPSGAGKSTLFNVIAGFQPIRSGSVEIFGKDMAGRDPAERPVSIVFQENNLFAHLTVEQNVGLGIDPSLRLDADGRGRVDDALSRAGLGGFGQRKPAQLSGGERQRVALARAIVRRRPILLLDEPFAALDPAMRADMAALLAQLREETNSTLLFITHQLEDVQRLADRAMFIDRGLIAFAAPLETFLEHRRLPALNDFLGIDR
ncbi:ATP-binding cassette domain-containing protein [Mycoplana rhizolycopersici]|uniref:ATP-binding cassette domain-containing protein n=1 Tax=Mycoplana rhizolycopersici TaxID=2746702 RepID=A0ABX2Q9W8_9HYPH|nr:ATP-binding cassette domain-containing protein [Rhizobium rhizolycopersici]NVP53792.1 ATP-binding cassette domain-containing protein [Rhizobium rhizolycopersici]